MTIKDILDKIKQGEYRFSDHAVKRMIEKSVNRDEVEETILNGKVIEEYPDDKYPPVVLFMVKLEKEETYMSRFQILQMS